MNSDRNSIEHKPAGQHFIRLLFRSTPLQRSEDRILQHRRSQSRRAAIAVDMLVLREVSMGGQNCQFFTSGSPDCPLNNCRHSIPLVLPPADDVYLAIEIPSDVKRKGATLAEIGLVQESVGWVEQSDAGSALMTITETFPDAGTAFE